MPLGDLTEATVSAALKEYEYLFSRLDVDSIVAGFADDAHVRYSSYEPFKGKERLRAFLIQRFAGVRDYRLTKRLNVLSPPRFAASWTAEWIDSVTGIRMEGFGTEILTIEDGLFIEWIANFSAWRHGEPMKVARPNTKEAHA